MIVTLVGMPGCGKSSIGRSIAGKLRMKHVDSDHLIERKYGKKLNVLIDEVGIDEFRRIEEATLLEVYNLPGENLLLSTGGSAIYSDKAMEFLRSKGKIVYLYCSYETIVKRLGDYSKRGIVLKPGQSLRELYDERCPLYKKHADLIINCDGTFFSKYQKAAISAISKIIE